MQICRPLQGRDQVRSGRWFSSIDIENFAVGHPKVAEAAVIGVRHPRMGRAATPSSSCSSPGRPAAKAELLSFLDGKIAKWWITRRRRLRAEMPHTATGKILKTALRDQFKSYVLPTAMPRAQNFVAVESPTGVIK